MNSTYKFHTTVGAYFVYFAEVDWIGLFTL